MRWYDESDPDLERRGCLDRTQTLIVHKLILLDYMVEGLEEEEVADMEPVELEVYWEDVLNTCQVAIALNKMCNKARPMMRKDERCMNTLLKILTKICRLIHGVQEAQGMPDPCPRLKGILYELGQDYLRNSSGETLLHLNVEREAYDCDGITEITQMLLAHGARVNAQDNRGNTPLHHLLSHMMDKAGRERAECEKTVDVLLDHGTHIDARNNEGTSIDNFLAALNVEYARPAVRRLECLAARAIKEHKVPHLGLLVPGRGVLPHWMSEFISLH